MLLTNTYVDGYLVQMSDYVYH